MWSEVEIINEKQKRDAEILAVRREEEEKARAKGLRGNAVIHAGDVAVEQLSAGGDQIKELLLIIKADVSGTVEAVVGALEGIGNKEAKVKILTSAVGPVTQADVDMARTAGGELRFRFAMVDKRLASILTRGTLQPPSSVSTSRRRVPS